jgi:hypothetical protein
MPMDWSLERDYAARDGYPEETPVTEAEWLAGCTDAELLGHLRSPGPHVRGCSAVDLMLGKS